MPKFTRVEDMTPEQRKRHEEIRAMLSPNVLAREEHRSMLRNDGEDESIADQCFESLMEDG